MERLQAAIARARESRKGAVLAQSVARLPETSETPEAWSALPVFQPERGVFDTSLPFAELKHRSHINADAIAAGDAPDFSARIRAGRPGFPAAPAVPAAAP